MTPTHDDLSARQLKVAVDAMHVCYMDHADVSVTTTLLEDMAKAAIAALSALPAAGGPRLPDRKCVSGNPLKDDFYKARQRDYVNGWDDCLNEVVRLNTTPPPEITK